ncbi:MAG: hypothetical protein JWN57_106 [Frankiales bacterium]|jgi:hypothetical protein|nr:hypothetical protein [Frankiales bacterium]
MSEQQPEGSGRTPSAPDIDQPTDGDHRSNRDDNGRTPGTPDVDQPTDGDHAGS